MFSVTNHVSQPYSRTDLTQALNNLILRSKLMLFALQTFFSLENAPRALFILCWMSKSVPLFSSILDPKYKKSSTRSIASSPILKASVVLLFTRRTFVFSMLTLSPTFWDSSTRSMSMSYLSQKLSKKIPLQFLKNSHLKTLTYWISF